MSKNWQILAKIEDSFIEKFPQYDRLTLQLLKNRGLTEKEAIEEFLAADYEQNSHDPFLFKNISAVELIIAKSNRAKKLPLLVTCNSSTALLMGFKSQGETGVYVLIGLGVMVWAINDLGTKLLITVDNGIGVRRGGMPIARSW
jgi:hypothetical protein